VTSRWAAVVVNYEAGELLVQCVDSLLADASAGGPPRIVVVDNGSADGSVAELRRRHPDVDVRRAGGNVGYARAANAGIAATDQPIVAVFNPDIVLAPGSAGAIVSRFEAETDLGAVGPVLENPDGSIYPSARSFPSLTDAVGHGALGLVWPTNPYSTRYRQLDADPSRARDVDWVSGAAIWLRREALETIDGWDEGYFMYGEDLDLGWRLRRMGWRVAFEPGARVVHVQGVSTDRHPYRMILEHHRSLLRFASKRWTGARRVLLAPAVVFLGLRALLAMAHRAVAPGTRSPRVSGGE
jgi:N-acetylglucosaminyl-diphospho-decaprenol L-rhamnosyltransferase